MRRMAVVLVALLFAAPVEATTVTVWCQQVEDADQVEIWYSTDGTLPRAFGLDITVSEGIIVACEPAMVGECNSVVRGYGIFPGTIIIDAAGNVVDYGTPVAPVSNLPDDTQPGLGSSGITIEMGSLYTGEANAPDPCGPLCTISVTNNCAVNIAPNVSRAGNGVVLENADELATVVLYACTVVLPTPKCFYVGRLNCCGHVTTQWEVDLWEAYGEPDCWCNPCHCRGDANGSCSLNAIDIAIFRNAWPGFGGAYNPCADLNYDGRINAIDITMLAGVWPAWGGAGCSACPPCP